MCRLPTGSRIVLITVAQTFAWTGASVVAASPADVTVTDCSDARRCYDRGVALLDAGEFAEASVTLEKVLTQVESESPPARIAMIRLRLSDAYRGLANTSGDVKHLEAALEHRAEALRFVLQEEAVSAMEIRIETAELIAALIRTLAETGTQPSLDRAWTLVRATETTLGAAPGELQATPAGTMALEQLATSIAELGETEAQHDVDAPRRSRIATDLRDCLAWIPEGATSARIERALAELERNQTTNPRTREPRPHPVVERGSAATLVSHGARRHRHDGGWRDRLRGRARSRAARGPAGRGDML